MKKHLIIIAAFTLMLGACKKDDNGTDTPTVTKSRTEQIIGSWQYVSITSDKPFYWSPINTSTDGMADKGECAKGTYITFEKGSSANTGPFFLYDNCEKSNSSDIWIFQNDILSVADDDWTIYKLDNSTLEMGYTEVYKKDTIKIIHSFKRKS